MARKETWNIEAIAAQLMAYEVLFGCLCEALAKDASSVALPLARAIREQSEQGRVTNLPGLREHLHRFAQVLESGPTRH